MTNYFRCQEGKYQPSEGQTSCLTCDPGYYCPGGQPQQIACRQSEGHYCPNFGMSSPLSISPGYFNNFGTTEQFKCTKGFYCPGGNSGIRQCEMSTWVGDTTSTRHRKLTTDTSGTESYYIWRPTTIYNNLNTSYNDCKIPEGSYCGSGVSVAQSDQCETNCCTYHSSSFGVNSRKCMTRSSDGRGPLGYECV
jgi:hypothetical protein